MPTMTIVEPTGESRTIEAPLGQTLMQAIRDAGIDPLLALCGGGCACGTCHVYMDEAFVDRIAPMSANESDLLETSTHRRKNSRLSCQIPLTPALDGATIVVAPAD